MGGQVLRIDERDNVAVALRPLARGESIDGATLLDDIAAGHKIALRAIRRGEAVTKYGYPIGIASADIAAGQHVHTHNVISDLHGKLADCQFNRSKAITTPSKAQATFDGFRRRDGRAATRNEIWIVNTVGCVNHASERIAAGAGKELVREGSGIEGIHAFT